nr:MAG TPA: hypothetical protein [Caudoviricetes sp.]
MNENMHSSLYARSRPAKTTPYIFIFYSKGDQQL